MRTTVLGVLALCATAVFGCGAQPGEDGAPNATADQSSDLRAPVPIAPAVNGVAPDKLVVLGSYSDDRFLDMLAALDFQVIETSNLVLQRATHGQLSELAHRTVELDALQIQELRALKQRAYGTGELPLHMNRDALWNTGAASLQQLGRTSEFDRDALDSLVAFGGAAIELASVAARRSSIPEIRSLAERVVAMNARDAAQLVDWRMAWFPTFVAEVPMATPSAGAAKP